MPHIGLVKRVGAQRGERGVAGQADGRLALDLSTLEKHYAVLQLDLFGYEGAGEHAKSTQLVHASPTAGASLSSDSLLQ